MNAGDPQLMEDLILRIVNKNTAKVAEIERKQNNMYDSLTVMEKTLNTLLNRMNKVEKEIIVIKKSMDVIKESDCL